MIFNKGLPNSPDVTIIFDGIAVDYSAIESVTIELNENQHDVATIVFTGLVPKAITDYTGTPVYICISLSPARQSSFYGYVTYTEPTMITRRGLINDSPVQSATVVCFGASYDMTETKTKAWSNITLPHLVETFATAYNYTYSVPSDFFTWPRLLQNNKSDWAFLKEVCNTLGYYMTTNGTHIHVYDPYKIMSRQLPAVELLTVRGVSGDMQTAPGRIMEFSGTFGDRTPHGSSSNYTLVGIDSSGKTVSASADDSVSTNLGEVVPARYTETITTNVASADMINRYATATVKNRYPFNAKAVVTGIPEPVPGSVAKVTGYDSAFDGFWVVSGVKHVVARSNFLTELTLATDSTNGSDPSIHPTASFKQPPLPAISKKKWVSSKPSAEVYV